MIYYYNKEMEDIVIFFLKGGIQFTLNKYKISLKNLKFKVNLIFVFSRVKSNQNKC